MINQYPAWRYHKTQPAVIVASAEEAKDLGSGWHDKPVKNGTTEVDASVSGFDVDDQPATVTGDDVFDEFLAANGMDKVSAKVQAMIRTAYDHVPTGTGTIPAVEYGHSVGPQDEVVMVDSEVARKALLEQAKDLGVKVHHASSSKTIQAAIDAFNAVKSSTPAASTAIPKDTDIKYGE